MGQLEGVLEGLDQLHTGHDGARLLGAGRRVGLARVHVILLASVGQLLRNPGDRELLAWPLATLSAQSLTICCRLTEPLLTFVQPQQPDNGGSGSACSLLIERVSFTDEECTDGDGIWDKCALRESAGRVRTHQVQDNTHTSSA